MPRILAVYSALRACSPFPQSETWPAVSWGVRGHCYRVWLCGNGPNWSCGSLSSASGAQKQQGETARATTRAGATRRTATCRCATGGACATGAPSLDGSACEPLPLPDGSLSSISRASAENTSGDTLWCRGLTGALPHSGLTGARRAAFRSSGRVPELSIFTVANFCVRARIWWNEQKVAPREQHYRPGHTV